MASTLSQYLLTLRRTCGVNAWLTEKSYRSMQNSRIDMIYADPITLELGHPSPDVLRETSSLQEEGLSSLLITIGGIRGRPKVVNASVGTPSWARLMKCSKALSLIFFFYLAAVAFAKRRSLGAKVIFLRDFEPHVWIPHFLGVFLGGAMVMVSVARAPRRFFERPLFGAFFVLLCKASMRRNRFVYVAQGESALRFYPSIAGGVLKRSVISIPLPGGTDGIAPPREECRDRLGIPQRKVVFLLFGNGKDAKTTFRAFSRTDPNAVLLVAGRAETAEQIDSGRVPSNLIYRRGFVQEDEVRFLFGAADCSILAYHKDFENQSGTLRTSCGYGRPVVASNVGEVGPMVGQYSVGLIYQPDNPDSLSHAVNAFMNLTQPALEEFRRNCRRFSEDFSGKNWARRNIELIKTILSESAGPRPKLTRQASCSKKG